LGEFVFGAGRADPESFDLGLPTIDGTPLPPTHLSRAFKIKFRESAFIRLHLHRWRKGERAAFTLNEYKSMLNGAHQHYPAGRSCWSGTTWASTTRRRCGRSSTPTPTG
jgi:hypothetical protein